VRSTLTPVFVVAPGPGGWRCFQEGAGAASEHETQSEAIDRARELARRAGRGRVRVHDARGRVEQQWTFWPRPRGGQRSPHV
jgi:hypothetical protein